jgi:hypothetical protein
MFVGDFRDFIERDVLLMVSDGPEELMIESVPTPPLKTPAIFEKFPAILSYILILAIFTSQKFKNRNKIFFKRNLVYIKFCFFSQHFT